MSDDARPMFGSPIAGWHRKFAWLPTNTFDRGWTWLRFVYRRRCQKHHYLPGAMDWWWQYRATPLAVTSHNTQKAQP